MRKVNDMDIEQFLYGDSVSGFYPSRGSLLIAEPLLESDIFGRSVILLLDEDKSHGHLGLVLNKTTGIKLREIIPLLEDKGECEIYCGGPVDLKRLFVLHRLGNSISGSLEVLPGLWIGGSLDEIVEYIRNGGEVDGKIRFFLGYSGWSKDQLQTELVRHSWALTDNVGVDCLLSARGEKFWRSEVERLGDRFRSWLTVPVDPLMN